jgi:hypothetical protein
MPPAFVLTGYFCISKLMELQPINSHCVLRQYRLFTLHFAKKCNEIPLRHSFRQQPTACREARLIRLNRLEVGHRLETPVPFIDLAVLQCPQAVEAEGLDIE